MKATLVKKLNFIVSAFHNKDRLHWKVNRFGPCNSAQGFFSCFFVHLFTAALLKLWLCERVWCVRVSVYRLVTRIGICPILCIVFSIYRHLGVSLILQRRLALSPNTLLRKKENCEIEKSAFQKKGCCKIWFLDLVENSKT